MKKIVALVTAITMGFLIGCAQLTQSVKDNPVLVKTSVQLATIEYLKYNPQRLVPMTKNIATVKTLVEAGELGTVDLIAAKITTLIAKDKTLLPEELMLANNIVELFALEAKKILEAQGFPDQTITIENRDTALQVLTWITDAVNLMRNRV